MPLLCEVGDDVGGIRDGTEKSVQLRHDDERLAVIRGGEELAACRTTGKWFAATDSRILEDLGEAESLHSSSRQCVSVGLRVPGHCRLVLHWKLGYGQGRRSWRL